MQCRLCIPDNKNENECSKVLPAPVDHSLFEQVELNDDVLLHSFPLIFYGERVPIPNTRIHVDSVEQNAPSAPLSLYRHK
jgi:hypothetical protein